MNVGASMCGRHASNKMSRHSNAALRSSRPSSIVCLNGPRSTTRTSSGCTTVFLYSIGSSTSRCGATSVALWCAAAAIDATAARRTLRSLSAASDRKLRTADESGASTACGRSTTACLTANATTQRTFALGEAVRSESAVSTSCGCSSASCPRHSATMLRHSSSLSQAPSSSASTRCWSPSDKSIVCCPTAEMLDKTSASACSSRYCCFGLACAAAMRSISAGMYRCRLPHEMPPSARLAAALVSSLSLLRLAVMACSTCGTDDRSQQRPISPRHSRLSRCVTSLSLPAPSRSLLTVACTCAASDPVHSAATHFATLCSACFAPPGAPPAASSGGSNAACDVRGSPLAASPAKKLLSASSAEPCSNALPSSAIAGASARSATAAASAGRRSSSATRSRSDSVAIGSSPSVMSTAASSAHASAAAPSKSVPYLTVNASSAVSVALRSMRLALRRKLVSSGSSCGSTGRMSAAAHGDAHTVPTARTAGKRVTSLWRRSRRTRRTWGTSSLTSSARVATSVAMLIMTASLTSWSWSCALRRSKTVSKSGRASGLSSATATHEHALPLSPPPPLSTRTSAPHTRSDSAETL
mmetsp:Transcript_38791/g.115330  ORF Transcript_38791/g.115330 Transcript_38791/m.115330 type:complete len:587 (+) Transcript_38791:1386-3146(+)